MKRKKYRTGERILRFLLVMIMLLSSIGAEVSASKTDEMWIVRKEDTMESSDIEEPQEEKVSEPENLESQNLEFQDPELQETEAQFTGVGENVTILFDKENYHVGETITATLTPEDNYMVDLGSITVTATDSDENELEVEFEVEGPDENGVVTVYFEAVERNMRLFVSAREQRTVHITCENESGEASVHLSGSLSPDIFYEGVEVTLSVVNTGDILWSANVSTAPDEEEVEFEMHSDSITFTMPDADVEILLYERESMDQGNLSADDSSITGNWQGSTSSTKKDHEPDVELGKSARWTDIEDGFAELIITEKDTSDYSNIPVDYIIILDRTRTMSLNGSTFEGGNGQVSFCNTNSPCINPNHYYYKGGIYLQLLDYFTGFDINSGLWMDNLPDGAKFWNRHYNSSGQNITPTYGNGCQDRLTMAKQGIRELLDLTAQQNQNVPASKNKSRVAFWSFGNGYHMAANDKERKGLFNYVGLTDNYAQVKSAVNGVNTYAGTTYIESLKEAYNIITTRNATDQKHKDVYTKVILVSDGMCTDDNLNQVRQFANQVKALPNTELFTLAIGMTSDSEGAEFLKELATSNSHTASFWQNLSFSGGTGSAFAQTLFNIDKKGGEVKAINKKLTDQIETKYWEPISVLSATGGTQNVSLNTSTGKLIWNIPEGAETTYSCTVRLKLRDEYRYLFSDTSYPTNRDEKGATAADIQKNPTKAGAVVNYEISGGIYNTEKRDTGVITPNLKYGTVHFSGEKHWTVSGSSSDSITIQLMRTLPSQSKAVQVNNAVTNITKNWRYEFTRRIMPDGSQKPLIKYDENGRAIKYEVTESALKFYNPLTSVITNKPADANGGVVVDAQLYNEPFKIKAQIKKVDEETGNPLSGAVFSVYTWSKKQGAYVPYKGTTNTTSRPHETGTMEGAHTGMIMQEGAKGTYLTPSWLYYSFDNQGKFRIIESKAPEGYFGDWKDAASVTEESTDADKHVYDFTISADASQNKSTVTVSNRKDGTFGDQRVLGRLVFTKNDLEARDTIPQGDATLEGATYRLYAAENIVHQDGATGTLYPKDAEVKVRFVSSVDGIATYQYDPNGTSFMTTGKVAQIVIEGLELGQYYLKEETASEGYLVTPDPCLFDLSYQDEKTEIVEIGDYKVYEQVKKQALSFYKVTGTDNADKLDPLKGAKFSVYLLSDLADGKYMELNDDEVSQAIIDDYRDTTTLNYEIFHTICPATVYEEKDSTDVTSGKLTKRVEYKDGKDGTSFWADENNENAYLVAELESNAKGIVTTPKLPYGRYLVVETTVPKNTTATRPFAITVTEDDEDKIIDGDGKGKPLDNMVILMDRPIMSLVRIVKYDTYSNRPVLKEGAVYVIHDIENAWFDYYTKEMTSAQKAAYKLKYGDLVAQYSQGVWMGTKEHPFTTKFVETNVVDQLGSENDNESKVFSNVYIETPSKLPSGVYELEELKAPEGYILQGKEGVIAKSPDETSAENHTFYERQEDGAWTTAAKGRARFIISSSESKYDEEIGSFVTVAKQSNDPAIGKISIYAEGEQLVSAKQEGSSILSRLGDAILNFFGHVAGIFVDTSDPEENEEEVIRKALSEYRDYVFAYENKPIKGAQFEIRAREDIYSPEGGANAKKLYSEREVVLTLTTDADGKAWTGQEDWEGTEIPKGLPLGKYTVTQITAGKGFALSEENVRPREIEITYAGQEIPVIYRDTSYTNPRQKVRIAITKQDAQNGTVLSGAVFGLYAGEDLISAQDKVVVKAGTLIATSETTLNKEGQIQDAIFAPDLPLAHYYVKELSAPAGYKLSSEKLELDASYQMDQRGLIFLTGIIKNIPVNPRLRVEESTIALTQASDIYKATVDMVKNDTENPLEQFTLTDSFPEQAWPTELWTGTYNQSLAYKVEYQTNVDDEWVLWAKDLDTQTNHHLEVPKELLGEEEHIQSFRMLYGTVDGGFSKEVSPAYMVQTKASATGSIPNAIELTGEEDGVLYRDQSDTLTEIYSRTISGKPAVAEKEPEFKVVDTVETEKEKIEQIKEAVRMVKEGSGSSAPQSKLIWLIAPKTGDKADILPWILLMTCFVGGMTGGWVLYRRKSKKKK